MVAPYQVLLEGEGDAGGLIWAPSDCDSVIRRFRAPLPKPSQLLVESAVAARMAECDPGGQLSKAESHHVLAEVVEMVLDCMGSEERDMLLEEDRAFIARRVPVLVAGFLGQGSGEQDGLEAAQQHAGHGHAI